MPSLAGNRSLPSLAPWWSALPPELRLHTPRYNLRHPHRINPPRWLPLPRLSRISHSSPSLDLSSSLQHRAGHRSSSRSPPSLSIFHRWPSQAPPLQGAVMSPAHCCLLHSTRITVQSTAVRPQSRHCHLRSCHSDVAHVIRPSSPMWPADLIPSPSSEGLLGTKGSLILLSQRCSM